MRGPLADLGATIPVFAAPMAGGPTTVAMVVEAHRAGGFGFLAGGYQPAATLASQVYQVRERASVFGVNLFAPNPLPVDHGHYHSYATTINAEAARFGIDLTAIPLREDDDDWADKVDLLVGDPVPLVSFTFGLPDRAVLETLQRAGSVLVQTVTSPAEAAAAEAAGIDALAVQSHEAGGHFGTWTPASPSAPVPLVELVAAVRAGTRLPIVAAGGLGAPGSIRRALAAGADAVMVGTCLLLTDESGASATVKAALADRRNADTTVTRAFTGRPARGLRNRFMRDYEAAAPLGYPAIHHLTSPLRRAATDEGDAEVVNLWAGTAHALAEEEPVTAALAGLAADL